MFVLALGLVMPSNRYASPEDFSVTVLTGESQDAVVDKAIQMILDETGNGVSPVTLDSWFEEAFPSEEERKDQRAEYDDFDDFEDRIDFIMTHSFGGEDEGFFAKTEIQEVL